MTTATTTPLCSGARKEHPLKYRVFYDHIERDYPTHEDLGVVDATSLGEAVSLACRRSHRFIPSDGEFALPRPGSYVVFPVEGSAVVSVGLNLTVLEKDGERVERSR